jgi:hypothetical protein
LSLMNFELTFPTTYSFLERLLQLANLDRDLEACYFCSYLCELTLIEYKMLKWRPSLIAISAVYLSKKILKRSQPYSLVLQEHTGYKEREVRECVREICIVLNSVKNKKCLESLFTKYCQE